MITLLTLGLRLMRRFRGPVFLVMSPLLRAAAHGQGSATKALQATAAGGESVE